VAQLLPLCLTSQCHKAPLDLQAQLDLLVQQVLLQRLLLEQPQLALLP
jgi:hypothetical protein